MTRLGRESIVTAAVDLVQEEGWQRLSVRAVAARLNVTPMALYRYFENGMALSQAVMTRIAAGFVEVRDTGDMLSDLEWWARRAHSALVPFPGAASRLLITWFEVPAALRAIEGLLDVVHAGGLRGFEAVAAVNAVFMYALMRAEAEQTVREAGAVQRSLRLATAEGALPHLSALEGHYTTARFDLHFEYGLRLLLDGIAARLAAGEAQARGGQE